VEDKLSAAYLGAIAAIKSDKKSRIYDDLLQKEYSVTAEAKRNLRTMVDFACAGQEKESFFITSSVQGEGKSFIIANIAVSMAKAGEKVLLVDCDLRRSELHRVFKISNSKGLSNFLASGTDPEKDIPGLIQTIPEVGNLYLLPCGQRPPNPSELLNTPKLNAFLKWAQTKYDRVLVDCPPCFPINDAMLIGRYVPRCVYVVQYAKTRAPLIRQGLKKLAYSNVSILGVVINMIRSGGMSSYSYSDGYYKYDYKYKYKDDKDAKTKKE